MADTSTNTSHASPRHGSSSKPLFLAFIGLALLGFWALASLLQIQTSEAFILRGAIVSFVPNWGIAKQPWDLVTGQLSMEEAKAVMWGWGIELIYLVCIIGYEVAHEGIRSANRHLVGWFQTGMFVLIAFDGWTDFQYGQLASGMWGQVGFALVTSFIVAFFGIIGLRFLEHAISDFSK